MPKLIITEEMLDAIEAVKGVRDSRMWDIYKSFFFLLWLL